MGEMGKSPFMLMEVSIMAVNPVESVQVDDRGRITLPKELRIELDLEEGDTLLVHKEGNVIELAKMDPDENPFAILAKHAIEEHKKGNTIPLEDIADRENIELDE